MQGYVGVFGGVLVHFGRLKVAHRLLSLALRSDKLVYVYRLVTEVHLGHVVHVVAQLRLQQVVCYHRVEHLAAERHAIVGEHLEVVLYVLSDFED